MKAATDRIEMLQDIFKNLQRKLPDAPNPEWLLPFMLTYSITLEPYEDIAQEFQKKLVQEERTPTTEDARDFLELICEKHAHKLQANKNNSNISHSRRMNHGGGNRSSNQGGKPNAKSKGKENKKFESYSKLWTKKIQPNKKWVDGQEKCPDDIF